MTRDAENTPAEGADDSSTDRRRRLGPVAWLLAGLVRAYQLVISPWLGPSCRFEPSCSAYALEAITGFGVVRGSGLALRRLSRCHPWHRGGHDPVPVRVEPSRAVAAGRLRSTSC